MALLDELAPGVIVKGLLPQSTVTVVSVTRHGESSAELVYRDADGRLGAELLYQESADALEIVPPGLSWSFTGDGSLFRLVSEAYRIRLAYLFDPLIAVHTSNVEPLPHQITAVYETMLSKQPLRYLLADDPGAGKTIMTGLLIKELLIRGDLHRCLIVAPGNLVEQWQDELQRRFHLTFEILTNDRIEASASGNAFAEIPLCIARLDKLSRDELVQERLRQSEWDLVVVDEAHKMSAAFYGNEIKYTKRYQLGELLGKTTRHFVLLTATPHNGKEEDFQLFLRLLDGDRFEGKFRDGVHKVDVSDLMRHMLKEDLYRFDGTHLFPERLAYTINYELSEQEDELYVAVTEYVRQEFNRADVLEQTGRRSTIGFALTTLQRRLASSPEAIYQSLKRRRERLEMRVQEAKNARMNATSRVDATRMDVASRVDTSRVGMGSRAGASPAPTIHEGASGETWEVGQVGEAGRAQEIAPTSEAETSESVYSRGGASPRPGTQPDTRPGTQPAIYPGNLAGSSQENVMDLFQELPLFTNEDLD
jgi:stress response protein YsnF